MTPGKDFGLGGRSDNLRPLLGHGIFAQDGVGWKRSRDLLRPQFRATHTKFFGDIQTEVEKFIRGVKAFPPGMVDLHPLFLRLTMGTSITIFFGHSLEKLESTGVADVGTFARAFDHAQHHLARRGRLGDKYWILGGSSFKESCDIVHKFVDMIVENALGKSASQSSQEPTERYVFLDELISQTRDPVVLRDQLLGALLAGRDTTASLLSWTL